MSADAEGRRSTGLASAGSATDHRFLALGVVAVAAAIIATLVVSNQPRRSDEPAGALQASPSPSSPPQASTSPLPSTTPATSATPPAIETRTFTSDINAFSLLYPADWTVTPATTPWSGSGEWFRGSGVDVFEGPGRRWFAVTAMAVPAGSTADEVAAAHAPARVEFEDAADGRRFCHFDTPGLSSMFENSYPVTWQDAAIGGHAGRLRGACGYVDGVVIVEGRAYIVSMFTRPMAAGDLVAFRTFADTISFETQPVTGSLTFTSNQYGYTIRLPAGLEDPPGDDIVVGQRFVVRGRRGRRV